jgi:hypothetical protein
MTHPTTELLGDLRERMVRIETKLDVHAEARVADKATLDDHEARLGKLENAYKLLLAAGAVLVFVLTYLQGWITSFLPGQH